MTTLGTALHARTPSGMKVAPMSYKKLEMVAEDLRPLLPKVMGHGGSKWKIDSWRILEHTLPQAKYNYCVAGTNELEDCAAFCIPENKLVVIREDIYDGLFIDDAFSRSTVIHELSHIVLNHAVTLHRGAILGKHEFFEDSEWQAKALTAAVMMPIEACKAAHSANELSQLCGTSLQASNYRIEALVKQKLLDEQRYKGSLFGNL
jgi:hypothetical protein